MTCCQVNKHGVSADGTAVNVNKILFYLHETFDFFTAVIGVRLIYDFCHSSWILNSKIKTRFVTHLSNVSDE